MSSKPGYHINEIKKGTVGEVSKIVEEIYEYEDAVLQGVKIMALVELSDLIGAIELHWEKYKNEEIDSVYVELELEDYINVFKNKKSLSKSDKVNLLMDITRVLNRDFPGITLDDLKKMSFVTQRAFINGRR